MKWFVFLCGLLFYSVAFEASGEASDGAPGVGNIADLIGGANSIIFPQFQPYELKAGETWWSTGTYQKGQIPPELPGALSSTTLATELKPVFEFPGYQDGFWLGTEAGQFI